MKIFDYFFYRLAKFYYRKDGIDAIRATTILSFVQGAILLELGAIIYRLIYGYSEVAKYAKSASKVGVILTAGLLVINHFLYKNKYWRFADKWRNKETLFQLQIRGWLVVLAILLPFILLLWLGTTGYRGGDF
jgi:hypothetical protein